MPFAVKTYAEKEAALWKKRQASETGRCSGTAGLGGKNIGGRDNPCAEYEEAAPRNMFRMGIAGCRDFFRGKMTGRRGRLDARAHSP